MKFLFVEAHQYVGSKFNINNPIEIQSKSENTINSWDNVHKMIQKQL